MPLLGMATRPWWCALDAAGSNQSHLFLMNLPNHMPPNCRSDQRLLVSWINPGEHGFQIRKDVIGTLAWWTWVTGFSDSPPLATHGNSSHLVPHHGWQRIAGTLHRPPFRIGLLDQRSHQRWSGWRAVLCPAKEETPPSRQWHGLRTRKRSWARNCDRWPLQILVVRGHGWDLLHRRWTVCTPRPLRLPVNLGLRCSPQISFPPQLVDLSLKLLDVRRNWDRTGASSDINVCKRLSPSETSLKWISFCSIALAITASARATHVRWRSFRLCTGHPQCLDQTLCMWVRLPQHLDRILQSFATRDIMGNADGRGNQVLSYEVYSAPSIRRRGHGRPIVASVFIVLQIERDILLNYFIIPDDRFENIFFIVLEIIRRRTHVVVKDSHFVVSIHPERLDVEVPVDPDAVNLASLSSVIVEDTTSRHPSGWNSRAHTWRIRTWNVTLHSFSCLLRCVLNFTRYRAKLIVLHVAWETSSQR